MYTLININDWNLFKREKKYVWIMYEQLKISGILWHNQPIFTVASVENNIIITTYINT